MNIRKHTLHIILSSALGILILFAITFHQTLQGLLMGKIFMWEEDAFKGRPLSELEDMIACQGQVLMPVDAHSFHAVTGRNLEGNQHALRFLKGKEYSWFYIGTAINIGYVVVEEDAGVDRAIEIIHARSVDSL